MTTQDFTKGIDITGLEDVTGSEMNQLVDVARTAEDKGLVIETTDTAVGVPSVPDPNTGISGITPIWWKRYLWKRLPYVSAADRLIRIYAWNDSESSIATYLKWQNLGAYAETALALANNLDVRVAQVETDVVTANTNASNATTAVQTAQTTINSLQDSVALLSNTLNQWQAFILEQIIPGDIRLYGGKKVFSDIEDEGFVECDGAAISRVTFSRLFETIGEQFGTGDGATTFNKPDFRGRIPIGAGTGSGLSSRVIGRYYGQENVQLTAAQSGLPAHSHTVPWKEVLCASGDNYHTGSMTNAPDLAIASSISGPINATESHTNIQPSLAVRYIIKT